MFSKTMNTNPAFPTLPTTTKSVHDTRSQLLRRLTGLIARRRGANFMFTMLSVRQMFANTSEARMSPSHSYVFELNHAPHANKTRTQITRTALVCAWSTFAPVTSFVLCPPFVAVLGWRSISNERSIGFWIASTKLTQSEQLFHRASHTSVDGS